MQRRKIQSWCVTCERKESNLTKWYKTFTRKSLDLDDWRYFKLFLCVDRSDAFVTETGSSVDAEKQSKSVGANGDQTMTRNAIQKKVRARQHYAARKRESCSVSTLPAKGFDSWEPSQSRVNLKVSVTAIWYIRHSIQVIFRNPHTT